MKTLKEIANEVGVSSSTISRAINRPKLVSYNTRRKIEDAMISVGYNVKFPINLEENLLPTVIVLMPENLSYKYGEIISSMLKMAKANRLYISIMLIDQDDIDNQTFWQIMNHQIIGIICIENNQFIEHFAHQRSIPIVLLDPLIQNLNHLRISCDHLSAAFKGTEYLIELGHENIAFITGLSSNPIYQARTTGYKLALARHQIEFNPSYLIEVVPSHQSGAFAFKQLSKMRPKPTAYFFQTDAMAISAISVASQMGYRVPLDLSIMGFDNSPEAEFSSPALTTVSLPRKAMAEHALNLILQYQKSPNSCQFNTPFETELIKRESCRNKLKELD